MARTKRNAGGGNTNMILLLAAAGVGVYGYMQGWFSGLFAAAAPAATTTTTAQLDPVTLTPNAAYVPPRLGTVVTNLTDALAQIAAGDAYVIPNAATFASIQAAGFPSGYNVITTTDSGPVLLRPDVYSFVSTTITNNVTNATKAGAAAASIQTAGQTTMAGIKQMMTLGGLSGFGQFRQYMATRTGRWR